ncbi:Zn-ribbon domain-containing OB-fold protein [Nocardia sp. X0981]
MYSLESESTGSVGAQRMAGTLMIRRCARCDKLFAPLTIECSSCASDSLDWVPSSGTGSILSWRVVDRAVVDRCGGPLPVTIAIVELDEGPWVYTSIEGEVPVLPSRPVRVRFQPKPRTDRFPVFAVGAEPEMR